MRHYSLNKTGLVVINKGHSPSEAGANTQNSVFQHIVRQNKVFQNTVITKTVGSWYPRLSNYPTYSIARSGCIF